MSKSFIGVDLSISSPGISCVNEDGSIKWMKFFTQKSKWEGQIHDKIFGLTYPVYSCDTERFHKLCSMIIGIIEKEIWTGNEIFVCLEGYSYGSTASRLFQIAENGGHFKYLCWEKGIKLEVTPPTVIKKLATGKGNSNKDAVYSAFVNKYGLSLHTIFGLKTDKAVSPISDISDSVFMAEYIRQKVLNDNLV